MKMLNPVIVKAQRLQTAEGESQLKIMIDRHYRLTGSERADEILSNWDEAKTKFWQIYPPSEAKNPAVTTETKIVDLRVSAAAPDGAMCFLPVGGVMTPEQTSRCAD